MYEGFYGLDYDPFQLTPDGRDVFPHTSFERARSYLEYGLLRAEGFVVITGPPGSGKTTLLRELIRDLPDGTRYAQLESSRLAADDLLRVIANRYSISTASNDKASVIEALRTDLLSHARAGGRSLLIVDEGQDLPAESLEELRLLTNLVDEDRPLLQIVLLGQPGLRELIQRPGLEQLHQRTVASCRLKPLSEDESVGLIRFRLERAGWQGDPSISTSALKLLHTAAEGIPRRLNMLVSRLMLHGFAEASHELGLDDAVTILEEMEDEITAAWSHRVNALRHEDNDERIRPRRQAAPASRGQPPAAGNTAASSSPVERGRDGETESQDHEPLARQAQGPGVDDAPAPHSPVTEPAGAEPSADSDPAAAIVPNSDNAASTPGPIGGRRAQRSALRSTAVVISLVGAVLAVALVVLAATPVGEAVGFDPERWLAWLRSKLPSAGANEQ